MNVEIDPRATWIKIVDSGFAYGYKVRYVRGLDPTEGKNDVQVYVGIIDERGIPQMGRLIHFDTMLSDGTVDIVDWLPSREGGAIRFVQGSNATFFPDGSRPGRERGPYFTWVEHKGIPSDKVLGIGLPVNYHVSYYIQFVYISPPAQPVPGETVEQATIREAKARSWMPINTDGALYKFAQKNGLGYPQSDEFEFLVGSEVYVGQVYNLGIVYVRKEDWGNVHWVQKP